jgi:hypothetical protein
VRTDDRAARRRRSVALWQFVLAVAVALGLGAAGGFIAGHKSGGSGGANTGTGTNQPLSKQAFLAAGDAICARTIQQVLPIIKDATSSVAAGRMDAGVAAHYFSMNAEPLFQQEIIGLRSISPPPQDSNTIKTLLSTLQSEIYALGTQQQGIASSFASGGTAAGFQPFAHSSPLAYQYGFRSCPFQKPSSGA